MITLHQAIFALNPSIVTIREENAFDANDNPVAYDMAAAQAKLKELQDAETAAQQAAAAHKASAVSKLTALGLSADEINALIG
jgi:citrate lyase alpha subunit